MATQYVYFKGKAKWAKVFKPDQKYDYYGLDFYPDDPEAFKQSGIQLQVNKDKEDGTTFFKVKRRPTQLIKGELVQFGAPHVFDDKNQPTQAAIGNGSEVTVKIALYDSQKGVGHRLESIRVENLVEYEGGEAPAVGGEVPEIPF